MATADRHSVRPPGSTTRFGHPHRPYRWNGDVVAVSLCLGILVVLTLVLVRFQPLVLVRFQQSLYEPGD